MYNINCGWWWRPTIYRLTLFVFLQGVRGLGVWVFVTLLGRTILQVDGKDAMMERWNARRHIFENTSTRRISQLLQSIRSCNEYRLRQSHVEGSRNLSLKRCLPYRVFSRLLKTAHTPSCVCINRTANFMDNVFEFNTINPMQMYSIQYADTCSW